MSFHSNVPVNAVGGGSVCTRGSEKRGKKLI